MTVDLNGTEVVGQTEVGVPGRSSTVLQTDGIGDLVAGSLSVTSDRALAGVVLFGGGAGVAGVGVSHVMSTGFVAPIITDIAQKVNTGFAVMSLADEDTVAGLELTDTEGTLLASGQLELAARGHRSIFVDQIEWSASPAGTGLDFTEFVGILRVQTNVRTAATVIRAGAAEFATLPVAPNYSGGATVAARSRPQGAAPTFIQQLQFAQVGNGGETGAAVSSQFLFLNLTGTPSDVLLAMRDDDGDPLALNLNGVPSKG